MTRPCIERPWSQLASNFHGSRRRGGCEGTGSQHIMQCRQVFRIADSFWPTQPSHFWWCHGRGILDQLLKLCRLEMFCSLEVLHEA